MIGARNAGADKAKQEGVKRVKEWLEQLLPADEREELDGGTAADGEETTVIVNQLACKEPGCPDVEVVITLLRAKPRPKLMFKIFKAAADMQHEEVASELQKALADEKKELEATSGSKDAHDHAHDEGKDSHDHAHDEGKEHDHAHGDDCGCGHDHDEGHAKGDNDDSKKQKHDHDHA